MFLLEIFILICIFGYLIGRNRTSTMIDIITTRFREAYTWIIPAEHELHQNPSYRREQSITAIKRYNNERRQMFLMDEEMKETHKVVPMVKEDAASVLPAHGLFCQDCSKSADRTSQIDANDRALAAVDILTLTSHVYQSTKFHVMNYFPHLAQTLRLKKYEYKKIFDIVLNNKQLKREIERVAANAMRSSNVSFEDEDKYYEEVLRKYTERTYRLLVDMRCTISDKLLRLTSYVLYKLLPCFLSSVVAHPAQIDMIKVAQEKMPNTPLIFLPLHRSHLDYILVTFILLNHDIRCPKVAAGDNLNMPVFGQLLRGLGAFFIKRKIDAADGSKDFIYRSLLQTYIQESIVAGHNLEFFIEGGRTRTGKPNMPKSGILSVIVEAFIDGLIDDAILVPVSVNYEKLVDGNFVREQMGTPKKKESFKMAMSSIWKVVNSKYGQMRIDFNEPFSLKELVKSFNERQVEVPRPIPGARKLMSGPSRHSVYGIEVIDKHRELVDNIARHVVFDCSYATSVMSTNALAFLLLHKYRSGATMKEISNKLTDMKIAIGSEQNFGFDDEAESVIKRAVTLLGPELVQQDLQQNGELFLKPVLNVTSAIELAYYANTFVPYFALDSVVVTSAATVNEGATMAMNDLLDTAMLYCDILRYEFIFYKPCQDFAEQIEKSVTRLCRLGIVSRTNDHDGISLNYASSTTLLSALAPFSLTYVSVVECLEKLIEAAPVTESEFVKTCLAYILERVDRNEITYGESISTDSIKNCLKLMEKWSVVEAHVSGGIRKLSLRQDFDSVDGVQEIVDRIKQFVILK